MGAYFIYRHREVSALLPPALRISVEDNCSSPRKRWLSVLPSNSWSTVDDPTFPWAWPSAPFYLPPRCALFVEKSSRRCSTQTSVRATWQVIGSDTMSSCDTLVCSLQRRRTRPCATSPTSPVPCLRPDLLVTGKATRLGRPTYLDISVMAVHGGRVLTHARRLLPHLPSGEGRRG